ncbi:glutamate decarboxylase-like [Chironomus tepperi]|uniref:glutamate decarboxylase-like n=1 Tax=Chironomus tepperi TaxID=113505 RepID=UPI00391F5874
MSSVHPDIYKLQSKIANLTMFDLLPFNQQAHAETREFLQKIVDILLDYIELCYDRREHVLEYHSPDKLKELFNMTIPHDGITLQHLITDCATVLKYGVKTGSPHFMNQLSCGLDVIAMAGEWLTATANCNMFTYEVSPIFIIMEHQVLKRMRRIIGFHRGDSVMAPGGTISNLYAVIVARYKAYPEYKVKGPTALPGELVIFTNDQGHYSMKMAAMVCGLGTSNCVYIPSDKAGRIIPAELERLILEQKAKGKYPILVNATAGTTVLGAFDPINDIADICEKYGLWLHVDAAWEGGLLLSNKHRHKLHGIQRANSVTWNPHKLMGTTLQCSTFHVREDGLLAECNKMTAEYLFMTDKFYDTRYDTGDRVIQCGRHNDIFKLWFQWRARGEAGFEARVDRLMELAQYQVKKIKEMPDKFYLLMEPEFVNVCFWYIPERFRHMKHGPEREEELARLCPIIKERMMKAGTLMVGYQRDGKVPNFFRSIISQDAITEKDIDYMLNEFDRLGRDL